jgi:hypothetical protein
MIMNKEKICPICKSFEDKNYISDLVLHINKLIKSKKPIEVLNKESGLVFTAHYYKKHREECLIDFEIPVEEQKIKLAKEKVELSYIQSINITSIITNFRNMSVEEKQNQKSKMMLEIEYIIINIVHHQLLYGLNDNSIKGIIPKDDINSLKIINEIMRKNDIEKENLNFEILEDKEKTINFVQSLLK